jgi:hypothetical protein
MGIFSFFAPKSSHSGGQVSFEPTGSSADAVDVRIQRPQATASGIKAMDSQTYQASDDKEWLRYLSSAIRTYRKPGLTLKDEHEMWLKARVRN